MTEALAHDLQPRLQPPAAAQRRMRVVIVDEELPFPLTSGKRIRTMNLLSRLADRHDLTFVCHRNRDPEELAPAENYFAGLGIRTIVVPREVPAQTGIRFLMRLAANLFSSRPYSVDVHDSPPLREAVARLAAQEVVDLWQCEWTPYAAALETVPGSRAVIMAHNVESQIWQRYQATTANPLKRWYIAQQYRKFRAFEGRMLRWARRTVTVSRDDGTLARDWFGDVPVSVVDNGVDTKFFSPTSAPRRTAEILFLGSLDWRPNQDAVRLLCGDIMPKVVAEEGAARLSIVGRNPPAWLAQLVARCPWAELHASVPDVRPYLAQAGMLAVPLRIGGGSRLKILEALAAGTPVVSTRIGAEGLELVAERDFCQVEQPLDMAAAIVRWIRSPQSAVATADAGRLVVLEKYDWSLLARRLEAVWLDCVENECAT